MSVWEYIIGAVLIVFSLIIIAIVLFREAVRPIWAPLRVRRIPLWKKAGRGRWTPFWRNEPSTLPLPFLCWYSSPCC